MIRTILHLSKFYSGRVVIVIPQAKFGEVYSRRKYESKSYVLFASSQRLGLPRGARVHRIFFHHFPLRIGWMGALAVTQRARVQRGPSKAARCASTENCQASLVSSSLSPPFPLKGVGRWVLNRAH